MLEIPFPLCRLKRKGRGLAPGLIALARLLLYYADGTMQYAYTVPESWAPEDCQIVQDVAPAGLPLWSDR